jgi:hypothetical protein
MKLRACIGSAIAVSVGCAVVPLTPGAEKVIVTRQPQPKSCKFLGSVVGQQGGAFSGPWTSNRNLAQGALNDTRNQALELGGNYVTLETDRAGVTGSGSSYEGTGGYYSEQTDVTKTGNVYICPPEEIGL